MYSSHHNSWLLAVILTAKLMLVPAPCPGSGKCSPSPPSSPPSPPPPPPPPTTEEPTTTTTTEAPTTTIEAPTTTTQVPSMTASQATQVLALTSTTAAQTTAPPTSTQPTTTGQRVDCVGQYTSSNCYGGFYGTFFNISIPAANGGTPCPDDSVTVQTCAHVPISLNWSYVVPEAEWANATRFTHGREFPLIVCPRGSRVSFTWSGGNHHDVWQLPSEETYNDCDFAVAGAQKKSDASTSSSYDFDCTTVGIYYLSCSVGDACSKGNQRVRIYVSEPEKTVSFRAKGGTSLEEFNRKYTLIFAGYATNQENLTNVAANEAIADAQSVLDNSPASCSDWIPAASLTDQYCRTFILTDLGFISRVRPTANYTAAENYYLQAFSISPGSCGATAYRAELRVQQDSKAEADSLTSQACNACGEYSLDFTDLELAYEQKGWAAPSCTTASQNVATERSSTSTSPAAQTTPSSEASNFLATTSTLQQPAASKISTPSLLGSLVLVFYAMH